MRIILLQAVSKTVILITNKIKIMPLLPSFLYPHSSNQGVRLDLEAMGPSAAARIGQGQSTAAIEG